MFPSFVVIKIIIRFFCFFFYRILSMCFGSFFVYVIFLFLCMFYVVDELFFCDQLIPYFCLPPNILKKKKKNKIIYLLYQLLFTLSFLNLYNLSIVIETIIESNNNAATTVLNTKHNIYFIKIQFHPSFVTRSQINQFCSHFTSDA